MGYFIHVHKENEVRNIMKQVDSPLQQTSPQMKDLNSRVNVYKSQES